MKNKLTVGFDMSQTAFGGGVGRYTQDLAVALKGHSEIDWQFFYSSLRQPYHANLQPVKQYPFPPTLIEIMFNQWRWPSIDQLIGPVDIYHSSDWTQPKTKALKVTTYHDLVPILYPQWSHPKIVEVHQRRLKIVEEEIDQVITVSESTKHDLLKVSRIPASKITVIYEGVDSRFKPQDPAIIEAFRQKYQLPKQFLLAIGGVGERRNLDRIKQANPKLPVMISGQSLPYLSDQEMPLLYAAAEALIYPSLYEGFGLPIIEAMAVGTPVLTSDRSAMAEVAGNAALLVNPEDQASLTKGIDQIILDQSLRQQLIKEGKKQAAKFSWQTAADQTVALYQYLAKSLK